MLVGGSRPRYIRSASGEGRDQTESVLPWIALEVMCNNSSYT